MRISDWSSDVCSSDLFDHEPTGRHADDAVDRLDPFERGVACLGVDLFLLDQPAELFRDPRLPRPDPLPGDLGEQHPLPRLRGSLHAARAPPLPPDPADWLHPPYPSDEHGPRPTRSRVSSPYV